MKNWGLVRYGKARNYADECVSRFDVRGADASTNARALSGGNLQKFIMGREIEAEPKVLLVSQPTWGVDVGAAAQIRTKLKLLLKLSEISITKFPTQLLSTKTKITSYFNFNPNL
jgi:ABC-type uncharacterized transport system ATPase subunit